jgi:hypothetical protein
MVLLTAVLKRTFVLPYRSFGNTQTVMPSNHYPDFKRWMNHLGEQLKLRTIPRQHSFQRLIEHLAIFNLN